MTALSTRSCEACHADAPKLTQQELDEVKSEIPDWEVVEISGEKQLKKVFSFNNFAEALSFANKVGDLAEQYDHHPALLVEWGKVTVRWWTHKIGGLHLNDTIMAAKTDKL